jgi:alkaline phosphatase D
MLRIVCGLAFFLMIGSQATAQPSRILFGSCADQNKKCPIWDTMVQAKPDMTILLGDNIYADIENGRLKPSNPEKMAQCYKELLALESFQKLRAMAPLLATWDDHDYGNNDAGEEWLHKDDAQKQFLDFMNVPADSPRRKQKGIYYSEMFGPEGKRVQAIMLDTRYFRSGIEKAKDPLPRTTIRPYIPNTDPKATMLGEDQWKWLEAELRKPAALRILGSSIQLISDEHPFEKWTNIPAERARLYKLIRDTNANGVVVISGDRHLGEISLDTKAVGYPLYDITSSGLNQASQQWRDLEANSKRVAAMPYGNNFGVIEIDWKKEDPLVSVQLRHEDGQIACQARFPLSLLSPKASTQPAPAVPLPEGVLSPAQALQKKAGDEVKVQFVVQAGRKVNTRILLNSEKDFRSEVNFTVVLNNKAWTGKYEGATYDTFKGKTIRATGKLSTFQGALQIQIDDEKNLEIVE